MPKVVERVADAGVGARRSPAGVDEVVVPGLPFLGEEPAILVRLWACASGRARKGSSQRRRQVNGPLGLVLRWPDDDRDSSGCFDEVLACLGVRALRLLELPCHPQCAAEELDVADLDAECLAPTQAGEGTDRR